MPVSSGGIGLLSAIADIARPLFGPGVRPEKKHVDQALKHAESAVGKPAPQPAADPPRVRRAVATAQLVRLEAAPALEWIADGAAGGWRCVGETTSVTVRLADGSEASYVYPAGTILLVTSGLILFPEESRDGAAS